VELTIRTSYLPPEIPHNRLTQRVAATIRDTWWMSAVRDPVSPRERRHIVAPDRSRVRLALDRP
jgi:hypothetical protein